MHADPSWMPVLLAIHIAAGTLCLVLAPLVLAVTKGGQNHRRWGKVYLYSIGVVAGTALPMALYRPVLFLAFLSVLSFYLAFAGYRALRLKNLAQGGSAAPIDWIAALLAFGASTCLVGFALFRPAWVQHMGIVAIVLGSFGMRGAAMDMYRFVHKPTDKMFWMYAHFTKFIASYIAIWTAFSTVALGGLLAHSGYFVWLWPTAVGVPTIVATTMYYRRRNYSLRTV